MDRSTQLSLEVRFFRRLNRVVEPLVRLGVGNPWITPGGFVVVENVGRKSGRRYRTPLAATRIGEHVLVATFRGDRSQWVRNLAAEPRTRFWMGGRAREVKAFVMHEGKRFRMPRSLPRRIQRVLGFLPAFTQQGWAFAVLSPVPAKRAA